MAARGGGSEFRVGAEFRDSLRRVFNEAKEKRFNTRKDFHKITATIVKFLALRRTMTGAQARASCPVRLPDGKPVSTQVALPPQSLTLNRETQQRLRRAETDREFIGILLSAQHEQMTKLNSPGGSKSERKRKRRARDIVLSSPDQSPPVKKSRRKATTQKAACHDGSPFAAARAKSRELLQSVASNGAVHDDSTPGQSGRPEEGGTAGETICSDEEKASATLKSGSKVQLSGKNSRCSSTPANKGPDVEKAVHLAGGKTGADVSPSSCNSPRSNSNATAHTVALNRAPSMTHASSAAQPQTPKRRRGGHDDTDFSPSDSGGDMVHASSATSQMDMEDPEDDDSLTSGQKLAKDIGAVLRSISGTKEDRWADKAVITEWLTMGHQRILKQHATGHAPTGLSGPATRLENIVRHIPRELEAVSPEKRATYLAGLKKFCNSTIIHGMDYEQRLLKIVGIVYLEEELDAVARNEWTRLEQIAGLCSIIAEAIGPEDEIVDEQTKNRWIAARKMDIASLKKLLAAKERCRSLGL
ncbi:hypothetical protein EsDP_00002808 [Epichloe bromicola]|uniref:Uncharacterized protein n=1 Tax=Epichloe bromicola TaxID=79588 RepID=A0ABQ0CLV9_9HYPO